MSTSVKTSNKTRIAPIDTWRAIAALGVVWIHCWTHFGNPALKIGFVDMYKMIAVVGNGVDFFFVISGFCLYIVWRNKQINVTNYLDFIRKRWLRIAPAFYAAAIIIALFLFFNESKNVLLPLLANILFFHNYSNNFTISAPFWSLAVEFQFYALIPLFIYFSRKNFLITSIVTYLISNILLAYHHSLKYHYVIDTKGIHFFIGILLAWIYFEKQEFAKKYFNTIWHFILAVVILFLGRYFLSDQFVGESAKHAPFFKVFGVNMLVIGFATATWVTIVNDKLNKIFSTSIGQWLGKLSYSIYLWHAFVMIFVAKIWNNLHVNIFSSIQPVLFFLLVLVLLIPISYLSYNWFEKSYFKKSSRLN